MKTIAIAIAACGLAASSATARDAQTAVGADGSTVSIEAVAATITPYRNQSILYTIRCAVRGGIAEITLSDIGVSNAIVERRGKPDIHDEVVHGLSVRVASFRYIVTPLKAGKLTIPGVTLSGKFEAPDLSAAANPLGLKLSSGVRQAFSFFSANGGEPFSVTSNSVQLSVKPPAAAMDPWLPLTSLKIIEDADAPHALHVGEPLSRKITLLADGAVGSQIPDLAAQPNDANFKTYADNTATGEDVDIKSGSIQGWRKESYSLIAQKAGRRALPGIRVAWWDIAKNKRAVAELPLRMVDVLPAVVAHPASSIAAPAKRRVQNPQLVRGGWLLDHAGWLLSLLGVVAAALLFFLLWRRRLQTYRAAVPATPGMRLKRGSPRPASSSARLLDSAQTAEDLHALLQAYALEMGIIAQRASLERIFAALPLNRPEEIEAEIVTRGLSAALYAGGTADIADLKARIRRILLSSKRHLSNRTDRCERLQRLNPS